MSLPFGLKVKCDNLICGLVSVKVLNDMVEITYPENPSMPFSRHKNVYKPILHPLSDLTKPIEHNGEKFVPMVELGRIFKLNVAEYCVIEQNIKYKEFAPDNFRFSVVMQLIEWHFDIAFLIEKGEAIDVNTLKTNPYL